MGMLSHILRQAANTSNKRLIVKAFCSSGLPLSSWRTPTGSSICEWTPLGILGDFHILSNKNCRYLHCITNTSNPQEQATSLRLPSHPSPDTAAEPDGASHNGNVSAMPIHEGKSNQGGETQIGPEVPEKDQKLLQVAIVGVPNAGKSTLTNALVGHKVSAVSPKTNTTSVATLGAFMEGAAQVVMYDTPGLVTKRYIRSGLHEGRVHSAWGIAAESDMLLLIIDGERQLTAPDPRVISLVKNLSSTLEPCPATVLVLNKIDKIGRSERPRLLNLIKQLSTLHNFSGVFLVSATQLKGVPELQNFLVSRATPGRWLLEPRQKTDVSEQDQAREIVREQIFMRMYKEVPYNVQLTLEDWKPFEDGSLRVEFILSTPNEQVRRMLIGKKGAVIGEMGIKARKELESLLGRRVHLILTAKTV